MPAAQTAPTGAAAGDVAFLKSVLPTQSHTMIDAAYHWSSLWFAVEKKNWPLARYFFGEARQAIRWTVVLRPTRQLPDGKSIDVKGIFTAVDMSAFAAVQLALEDEDHDAFVASVQERARGVLFLPHCIGVAVLAAGHPDNSAVDRDQFRTHGQIDSCPPEFLWLPPSDGSQSIAAIS